MPEIKRFECTLRAHIQKVSVNVFTNNPDDVPQFAKLKAAAYLKRVHKLPSPLADIDLIEQMDCGAAPDYEPDTLTPTVHLGWRGEP